jgi:hypothetical protein
MSGRELIRELSSVLSEIEELEKNLEKLESNKSGLVAHISFRRYNKYGVWEHVFHLKDVYLSDAIIGQFIKEHREQVEEKKDYLRNHGFSLDTVSGEK